MDVQVTQIFKDPALNMLITLLDMQADRVCAEAVEQNQSADDACEALVKALDKSTPSDRDTVMAALATVLVTRHYPDSVDSTT